MSVAQNNIRWITSEKIAGIKSPLRTVGALFGERVETLIIACHGFGDNAANFAALATQLKGTNTLWLFPEGPKEVAMSYGGFQWFSLFGDPSSEMDQSQNHICSLAFDVCGQLSLAPQNVFLLGFSQGASIALQCGLKFAENFGGIIALSGFMLKYVDVKKKVTSAQGRLPRVFLAHGSDDQVVFPAFFYETKAQLQDLGVKQVKAKIYPMGHTILNEELADIQKFLAEPRLGHFETQ